MANASADKLKALAIRHGEKAVVGITATLFVVFVVMAIMNPVLEMKPEQLKTSATNAQANLNLKQTDSDILAKLEKEGLKEPNFQKTIEEQIANSLKPDDYRARLDWVTLEPGAGLIRDMPELIAPVELTAFPGRGGVLMFALDKDGERIIDQGAEAKGKNGGRAGGLAAAGGSGGTGDPKKKETAEDKRKRELEEKKQKDLFAGKGDAPAEKKDQAEAADSDAPQGPYKEEVIGKRWVVITAMLDNAKLKKNYLTALKNEAVAYPNFKRVDVQRQTLQSDGSWSEWTDTEKEKNWLVIDNLPEVDVEYVPESQRPSALVDPLPFLKAGYWTGVHVAKLVPSDVLKKKESNIGGGSDLGEVSGGGKKPGQNESRQGGPAGPGKSMGNMPGGSSVQGGPGGPAGGGDVNFAKFDDATLMIRSLDFTVEPDQTYRFRLRIVVVNPNLDHTDVNPGVDVETKQLFGPWSEPSPTVTVPADVVAYARNSDEVERRDDLVNFQVVRWDPSSGQTVIKVDSRGPGEIIGEYGSVQMPNSEGSGPKSERIDFNSRSIVLDTFGGRQKLPDIGVPRNQFEVPALAMIVQPNGDVILRSQALDKADEVRQDMEANYEQALKDSGTKREKGSGSRMPGLGGGQGKKKGGAGSSSIQGGGGGGRPGSGGAR